MEVSTVLLLLPPLLFILGLGEIASRMVGRIWTEFHESPRRKPLWLFRGIGCLGSLGGLVLGYYWGYHQPTENCGSMGCGFQAFFNGMRSSVAGACLGAMFTVIGVTIIFWLRKSSQSR